MRPFSARYAIVPVFLICFLSPVLAAGGKDVGEIPDFTNGDKLPEGAPHDWNLGPTGARGWMFSRKMETRDARQIYVTKVAKGSPSDGKLKKGDVILGVGGKPFSFDPRVEFGRAITHAESNEGGGKLSLTVWRDGSTESLSILLPVLGTYSDTSPWNCPKSERILTQGFQYLAGRVERTTSNAPPITRSLNALALLASENKKFDDLIKREANWASKFTTNGYKTWHYGYVMIFLSEYILRTDDRSVLPGLRRLAVEAAQGQSKVGSWGHRFAKTDGRLGGYGMMNSPGIPLTIGLVMATNAGVEDPEVTRAIQKSAQLIRFYVGKGSVPYGDHHPWIQTHEDNGKNGMSATLFDLLGEDENSRYFSRMCVAAHGAE